MLNRLRWCACIFLALVAMSDAAGEGMTLGAWPSAVTTLIVHSDGSATFICNSTNAKVCSIAILDDACTDIAKSKNARASNCRPERLSHFQLELGHKFELKTVPANVQYCASSAEAVVIRACLLSVQWIETPYSERPKISAYFHFQ